MSHEVPEGWRRSRLDDLIKLEYGKALASAERREGAIPVFGSSGIVGYHDKAAVADPSIVLSRKGSLGGVFYIEGGFWPIDTTYFVVQKKQSDWRWLTYLLQFASLERLNEATGVPGLNRDKAGKELVSVPPLHEQRRIAEILSSVDEAIAATRAVIEQTRIVKQGVLERLLTKGIDRTCFKQTEIGEIPEGWRTGKIGDFFTLQRGFDITEKQSKAGEYPVVSSSGTSYFHSEAMVRGPAVITGRKGKLGQVHFIDGSCWPHDTTLWVKDFKGNAPKFVYWFLRSLNLEKFDAATAVPTLNRNVVHALGCVFPPISEQRRIADHLDSIEATEDTQTRSLVSYGQMKSALMSDLLTGRKRVTDALLLAAE
jgi:type I restriction enzyme S subunit